jgi:pseudaminic acid synthase
MSNSSFAQTIVLDGRRIGPGEPPYIIAELSANHGGSLERALRIIDCAAKAGVHAVKFQAYTPGNMTLDSDKPGFIIEGENPWKGRKLYDLYAEAKTPYDWFPALYERARQRGITPFATPFGVDAVAILEELDTPVYKIASFEAVDHELIKVCARTGKPILLSTGMCNKVEIEESLQTLHDAGAREVGLFRCNSGYPAKLEETNLLALPDMINSFAVPIGFSDHTIGPIAAVTACALGACMIEKHVIDAKEPPTPDSSFSILPDNLAALTSLCRDAFVARGDVLYGPFENEMGSINFRRSIYACADISDGETITDKNVRCIRPGFGLHPRYYKGILGKTACHAIQAGDPLTLEMFE